MFIQYIKSYFYSLRKNSFFYTINFLGFSIGILLVTIILTFAYQELSFDRFHKNAENIYRVNGGGYGVTPLCFAEKLRNKVPDIRNIIRFSSGNLKLEKNNKKLDFGKLYYTDPEIFQVFSFKLLSGNTSGVLKDPYSIVLSKSKLKSCFQIIHLLEKHLKIKMGEFIQ
jgi:putative ABC transport system permease protein